MRASARTLGRVRTDTPCLRGRVSASAWMLGCVRTDATVHADAKIRPRGRECLPPGNFITDATVCPSHGLPSGHRPSVCPLSFA
jgi:hypothetical protein